MFRWISRRSTRRAFSSLAAATHESGHPMAKVWRRRDLISQLLKCESKEMVLEIRDTLEGDEELRDMPLTAEEADRMIRRYAVFNLHDNVTSTLNRYRESAEEEESRVIHSTIHAFSRMKMFDKSVEIFEEHKNRVEGTVSPRVYLTMLRSAAMSKNSDLARKLIEEINETFEFDLSDETPSRREKIKSHRDFEVMDEEETLTTTTTPVFYKNAIQRAYNLALASCVQKWVWDDDSKADMDTLTSLLKSMEEKQVPSDDRTRNAVLHAQVASKNWSEVVSSVTSMIEERPPARLNRKSLEGAIRAASEIGDWESALKFKHKMSTVALPVSTDATVACMKVCNDREQYRETILLFDELQRSVKPCSEAVRLVRVACIEERDTTQAKLWGLFE